MVSPRRRPVELFTLILAVVLGVSLLAGLGRDTTDSAGAGFEGSGRVVIQNVVKWVFVSGRALKRDGRIVGDQGQVIAETQAASDRIQNLLGLDARGGR